MPKGLATTIRVNHPEVSLVNSGSRGRKREERKRGYKHRCKRNAATLPNRLIDPGEREGIDRHRHRHQEQKKEKKPRGSACLPRPRAVKYVLYCMRL